MKKLRPVLWVPIISATLSAAVTGAAPENTWLPPNHDQAAVSAKSLFDRQAIAQRHLAQRKTASGMPSQFDANLGKATFIWGAVGQAKPSLSLVAPKQRREFAANFYLNALTGFAAGTNAANKAVLAYIHDVNKGPLVAKYRQEIQGIEVFNREYNVVMDREYNLVAGSGYFAAKAPAAKVPGLLGGFGSAENAIQKALEDLSAGQTTASLIKAADQGNYEVFDAQTRGPGLSVVGQPRAKKVFYELKGGLQAAYYIEVRLGDPASVNSKDYSYVIGAADGKVLFRRNLIAHASEFTYRVYANQDGYPWEGPHGDVVPALVQGRDPTAILDAPRVTLPYHSSISTRDPWLAADASVTSGNNVFAYADVLPPQDFSAGDFTAETTSPQVFDYQLNGSESSTSVNNRKAAIVNLFYLSNFLHDWWYDHGFDEASGNAQLSNYGRGGVEGDPLEVQAQDHAGFNNANMSTPADGGRPRMQQFLFFSKDALNGVDQGLTITSHTALGLLADIRISEFGPRQYDLAARDIARIDDGDSGFSSTDGCEAAVNGDVLAGKIVIIDRGSCDFTTKVLNAQAAGAVGAIIVNNSDDGMPAPMGGTDPTVVIPNMGITFTAGQSLYDLLEAGETVRAEMFNNFPLKDSSMDNAIVAHEWGHYIQNRLIGNANGLINFQGRALGEGWSDFHALMLVVLETDTQIAGNEQYQANYGVGTFTQDFYTGIRRAAYSTNMDLNPLTFRHIADGATPPGLPPTSVASPHNAGEVWGAMLWDVYVSLLNTHEFSVAQSRMANYLVASYKLTPISPTYTEARDALLAAIYAHDAADYERALAAFARRGMGLGAVSPARDSIDNTGVVESYQTRLATFKANSIDIDENHDGVERGFCSDDGILDRGETGTVSVAITNGGSDALSDVQGQIEVLSGHDVTLENAGLIDFGDLGLFETVTSAPMEITLNNADTADTLALQVTFPELGPDDAVIEPQPLQFSVRVNMDFSPLSVSGNRGRSDMESLSLFNDWKENVIFGGEDAEGTQVADNLNTLFFNSLNPNLDLGTQTMFLVNNPFPSDVAVETLPVEVAFGSDFSISFWHFYWLEPGFDGGVVEISVNGDDWVDVTSMGGVFSVGYTDVLSSQLPGRGTYTGMNGNLETSAGNLETISFGTALNGQTVRFRFRIVSDESVAAYGWNIDNVTVMNIQSPVFSELVAGDIFACDNAAPKLTLSASELTVDEGVVSSVTVSVTDRNIADTHTYDWVQTAGPAAMLSGTDTNTLTFSAADVTADTALALQVTVNDGTESVTSTVAVTVNDVPPPSPPARGNNGGGGSMAWYTLLLLPLMWRRKCKISRC